MIYGSGDDFGRVFECFVAAGGAVLVCPYRAAEVGLDAANLRAGAKLGTVDDLTAVLLAADKILDY